MGLQFAMRFLKHMQRLTIERKINQSYAKRLAAKGCNPEGVFWNSRANQINRFSTLLALIETTKVTDPHSDKAEHPVTIAEIGCGYGALFGYLREIEIPDKWHYHGVDINPSMIAACQ